MNFFTAFSIMLLNPACGFISRELLDKLAPNWFSIDWKEIRLPFLQRDKEAGQDSPHEQNQEEVDQ